MIGKDTDILLTHAPPKYTLDMTLTRDELGLRTPVRAGSEPLAARLKKVRDTACCVVNHSV